MLCRLPNWVSHPREILKSVLDGLDVGDINHSSKLYSNFMPFVSEQVAERLKRFFSSRLDKPIKGQMFTEQDNLHLWPQFFQNLTNC